MKNSNAAPLLFFLVISAVLIFSWFRFGYIYGGGDTGLPTYNPQAMVNIAKDIWWDSLAPGIPVAQGLTSVPMLFLLSIPQILGAGPVFLQALLFFILLFLMGYGMYLLALNTFGRGNHLMALAAGVFYLFNPYMMVQIWHRFIHNSMFLVAFLPFLVWTWLLWIRKRNPLYLLLFLIVNFLAVYIYGTIAFIVAVWTLLILLTLLEASIPWKGRKVALNLFLAFLIGFVFWLLTNSWWLIPTFNVSPSLFASQHTTSDSVGTLMSLSSQTILPFTLRLINPFYLYWHADFGTGYQNIFFQIISWLFVLVVFVGFVRGLKERAYASWSLLVLILIFLAKGAAPPFNFPYIWGFSNFFPLGVIRNPFEKLGVLLPLVYALLFASGLQFLVVTSVKFIGKPKTILLLIIFICLHLAFFWPMFAGKLFGTLDKQNFVSVPKSYTQADEWIRKDLGDSKEGRILHLPLPRSEDVAYQWQYGYSGVEPSAAIFTSLPSIARGLNLWRIDDTLTGLSLIFNAPYSNNPKAILRLLQAFNVRFIVLHSDMVWQGKDTNSPDQIGKILNSLSFLKRQVQFGDLIIYELLPDHYLPKVVTAKQIHLVYPKKATIRMWPWMESSASGQIITPVKEDNDLLLSQNNEITIFPQDSFNYLEVSDNGLEIVINDLALQLYSLLNTKSTLSKIGDKESENLIAPLISSGEDLINSYIYLKNNNPQTALALLQRYQQTFGGVLDMGIRTSKLRFAISSSFMDDYFKLNYLVLDSLSRLEPLSSQISPIKLRLKEELKMRRLIPKFTPAKKSENPVYTRQINQFQVPATAKYELLLTNSPIKNIYPQQLDSLDFQINETLISLKGEPKDTLISYGLIDLKEGINEISFNNILSVNLITSLENVTKFGNVQIINNDTVKLSSDGQKPSFVEMDLEPVSGEDVYQVNFLVSFESGSEFFVQIIQGGDPLDNGNPRPTISASVYNTKKDNSLQMFGLKFQPLRAVTRQAKIRIIVDPFGIKSFNTPVSFGTPTTVQIKNLNVFRILDNKIYLKNSIKSFDDQTTKTPTELEKISPVLYKGKVKFNSSGFFIFNEAFHPDWKLELSDNQSKYSPANHYLANLYANGWYIDKPGDYDFKIYFKPQNYVTLGIIITAFSASGLFFMVFQSARNNMKK